MFPTSLRSRPILLIPAPPCSPIAWLRLPQPWFTFIVLAWLSSVELNPPQPGLAWHSVTFLNSVPLTEGKRRRLNLGTNRYTSPNLFFIKLTVIMKKPFLLPCFPSPAFSLLLRLVCLPNTFTFKDRAVIWCFTVERSPDEMKVCSTLCVFV